MNKIKKVLLTIFLVVITIILSTILSVYAATTILGSEVSYTDTNNRLGGATNVQAAIDATYNSANTLASNVTSLDTRVTALEDLSTAYNNPISSLSLYNCTGSVGNNQLKYRIFGKTLALSGKIIVNLTNRSGGNPGVSFTIPNSKSVKYNYDIMVGPTSYLDGPRYGETTNLTTTGNSTTIYIRTSESFANVSNNKKIVLIIPMTFITLN